MDIKNKIDNIIQRKQMRGRNRTTKKKLFDSEQQQEQSKPKEQEEQTYQQKTKNQKMVDRVNQMYDAAKIQENQVYIGRQKVQEELSKQKKKQLQANKTKKKIIKNKNLFESDQDSNKEQLQKKQSDKGSQDQQKKQRDQSQKIKAIKNKNIQINKQEIYKNNQKNTPTKETGKKQESQKSDQQQRSQSNDQEQQKIQKKRQENIKKMVESQTKITSNGSKLKEISFSKLVQEAGTDKQELKVIIYEAIPIGYKAVCIFRRIQTGFTQTYELKLQDNERALFYCENQRGSIGANYYISLTKEMDKKSNSYLGKLRGNSTGSVYLLYDNGRQPQNNINRRQWRSSMARIQYESNFMGMNGPRKLKAILPNAKSMEDYDSFKLAQNEDLSTFQSPLIVKYKNKEPKWNQRLKSYALNFGGRVKQASIKNFILVQDLGNTDQEFTATNNLVFGKIDDHSFSLEVVYPLSIYQAFGIVMSQFDFKLSCQ